jgi:hypothetical protein
LAIEMPNRRRIGTSMVDTAYRTGPSLPALLPDWSGGRTRLARWAETYRTALPLGRIAAACSPRTISAQCEYAAYDGFDLLQVSLWCRPRLPWQGAALRHAEEDLDPTAVTMSLTHLASGARLVDSVRPRTGLASGLAVDPVRQPARRLAPCLAVIIAGRVAIAIGEGSRLLRLEMGVYRLETMVATPDGIFARRHEFRLLADHNGKCRGVWR